jgi:hypothetical protein
MNGLQSLALGADLSRLLRDNVNWDSRENQDK